MIFKKSGAILCTVVIVLATSCVSYKIPEQFNEIEHAAALGDYSTSIEILEEEREELYPDSDKVLYELDTGMLAHYAQDYTLSNTKLSEAEKLIYEYYAKSISQTVGSAILNDTIIDYAGEDYEDIYTNAFMALNYIHLGEIESAFVEIRRFDNKLRALSVKYREQILEAQKLAEQNYPESEYDIEFTNSAFARYISLLLYRSENNISSAEVDLRLINRAFSEQPNLYPFTLPQSLEHDIYIPKGKGRLNYIALTGLPPFKIAETTRVPLYSSYLKIELPIIIERESEVNSIFVLIQNSSGSIVLEDTVQLEKIESIERIVADTFEQRQALIYLKSIARAIAKTATTEVLGHASRVADSGNAALIFGLLNIGSQIFNEVSEQADLRVSHFFPSTVHVGGSTLDPGEYNISIVYKNANGRTLYTETKNNVTVVEGNDIQLIESSYLN